MNTVIICSECGQGNYRRAEDLHAATDAQYVCDNPACGSEANDRDFTWELEPDETLVLDEGRVAYLKAAQRPNPFSETSTTTADDVRAVAYIVEDIEALGVHVASASWVGYTDHPLTVQVSGDEAAVDTVAAALDLDPDDGTSFNYVRMSGRVLVYSGRSGAVCTCRATCHHKAVTA